MKKILSILLLFIPLWTIAQDNARVSLFKVSDAFIQSGSTFDGSWGYGYYDDYRNPYGNYFGGNNSSSGNASLADFKKLAPNSILLNRDFSAYSAGWGYYGESNSQVNFSASIGMQLRDQSKTGYRKTPLFRLGVSYNSQNLLQSGMYASTSTRVDTLTSSQTGQQIYVDSFWSSTYNMNYYSEQIRLDASMIFRTNPDARWSAYGGVGLTAGMSINAYTTIDYSEYSYGGTGNFYDNNNVFQSERIKNKTNFGFSTYIPVGVDFRIGNKREFWKHMHLYYEWRPQIDVTVIPELSSSVSKARMQSNLGFRVNF